MITIICHQHENTGNWKCYYNGGLIRSKSTKGETKDKAVKAMIQYFLRNGSDPSRLEFKNSKSTNEIQKHG